MGTELESGWLALLTMFSSKTKKDVGGIGCRRWSFCQVLVLIMVGVLPKCEGVCISAATSQLAMRMFSDGTLRTRVGRPVSADSGVVISGEEGALYAKLASKVGTLPTLASLRVHSDTETYAVKGSNLLTGLISARENLTGSNYTNPEHHVNDRPSTQTSLINVWNSAADPAGPSHGQFPAYQSNSGKYTTVYNGQIEDGLTTRWSSKGSTNTTEASGAVYARDNGVDCTGGAPSDTVLARVMVAGNHLVVPERCIVRLTTSKTYPMAIEFKQGGMLKPDNGVTITLTGVLLAGRQQIFSGAGKIDFTGNTGISEVYPEWWGAASSASAPVNTAALQAAVFGAFGRQNRLNGSDLTHWNKALSLCGTYSINGEIQFYHVIGFDIHGCGKLASGIIQTAQNKRIVDGQNIAYGTIRNLSFSTTASQTGPLVDLDNDHSHGSDLSPQNITFEDVTFGGNNLGVDVGVLIAKHGGDAQGDNIRCINCYFSGFSGAGWQIGGNNAGRNVGRYYAYNAIKEQIEGGDCQGNRLYCIAAYAGSFDVDGMTTEDDSNGFGTQVGYDFHCEAPQDPCIVRGVRSESHKLASGVAVIEHSYTLFQASQWYSAGRKQSMAGKPWTSTSYPFSGTGQCGDGKYYQATNTTGTFGGLGATRVSSATSTSITVVGANWATNAFKGQQVCLVAGVGNGEWALITGNTANAITFSGGLQTNYYQLVVVTPDTTSTFVIEPHWKQLAGAGPWTNGTVTFNRMNFDVIDGGSEIYDVVAMGGQVNVSGASSVIDHLIVSRTDWAGSDGVQSFVGGQYTLGTIRDVVVGGGKVFDQQIAVSGMNQYVPWALYRNSGGNSFFSGPDFYPMGTKPICWEQGQTQGGMSTNDVCIGIRNDPTSTSSESRAVLGFMGTLGPATAWGTNKSGALNRIQGGLPTGTGVPGDIAFSTGNAGPSGSSVIDGTDRWKIVGASGHLLAGTDSLYDIGASGANRPRDLWLGRNLDVVGNLTVHGTCTGCSSSVVSSPAMNVATTSVLASGNHANATSKQGVAGSGAAAGPFAIPWVTASSTGGSTTSLPSVPNKAIVYGVVLAFPLTTTRVTYEVTTEDRSPNTYDLGVYDASGDLRVHTGPIAGSTAMSTGLHTVSWRRSAMLQPGRYYLAITSSCTAGCGQIAAMNENGITFLSDYQINVSMGGILNENIAPPEDTFSFKSSIPAWIIH